MNQPGSIPPDDRHIAGYLYLLRRARAATGSNRVLHLGPTPDLWLDLLQGAGFENVTIPAGVGMDGEWPDIPPGQYASLVIRPGLELLSGTRRQELAALAFAALPQGGLVIVESPNPESSSAMSHMDPPATLLEPAELQDLLEEAGFAGCWIKRSWITDRTGLSWSEARDPRLRQKATSQEAMRELKSKHEGELLSGIGWKGVAPDTPAPDREEGNRSSPRIHWATATFRRTGYATLARACIQALDDEGVEQSVRSSSQLHEADTWFADNSHEARRWRRLLSTSQREAPCVIVGAPYYPDGTDRMALIRMMNPGAPAYIGLTMFETDRLPRGWRESLDGLDEIWVPSRFNQQVFISSGVDERRVQLVPFGVDARFLAEDDGRRHDIPNRRRFAFLSVFLWSRRKGPDLLLDAYTRAFKPTDDVCLILRCIPQSGRTLRQHVVEELARLGRSPSSCPLIILFPDFIPESAMASLYRSVQAFVLPSRGEGLGLPYMEAMAAGLPVIGTRWGAQLDFMDDRNSYLIDNVGEVPVGREATAEFSMFEPDHRWASPSSDHLIDILREVHADHDQAQARGRLARICMRENWTMQRTVEWMKQRAAHF